MILIATEAEPQATRFRQLLSCWEVWLHKFGCEGKRTVHADDLEQNEDQDVSAEYEFYNLIVVGCDFDDHRIVHSEGGYTRRWRIRGK